MKWIIPISIIFVCVAGYFISARMGNLYFARNRLRNRLSEDNSVLNLRRRAVFVNLENYIEKLCAFAGIQWRFSKFLIYTAVWASLGFVTGTYGLRNPVAGLILSIGLGTIPIFHILSKKKKKTRQINVELERFFSKFNTVLMHARDPRTAIIKVAIEVEYPTLKNRIRELADRLNAGDDLVTSLNDFAEQLQNRWCFEFADMVQIVQSRGSDLGRPLRRIIEKMKNEQAEKKDRRSSIMVQQVTYWFLIIFSIAAFGFQIAIFPDTYEMFTGSPKGQDWTSIIVLLMVLSGIILFSQDEGG